jgi:urea carboxylase
VATPLDPRHRLVTTKYNPARTWTPENAVGIGGAYLCVYGMEGPGGYQFVGRTVQMWNRWRDARQGARDFEPGKPWLLRFFDQIRFYPVSAQDLPTLRRDFVAGRMALRIEPGRFRLSEYERFLRDEARSIASFKQTQQLAFEAERERWRLAGLSEAPLDPAVATDPGPDAEGDSTDGDIVRSEVSGGVWQVLVAADDLVVAGQVLVIVESMKMEITVQSPRAGRVERLMCAPGQPVGAGQALLRLR